MENSCNTKDKEKDRKTFQKGQERKKETEKQSLYKITSMSNTEYKNTMSHVLQTLRESNLKLELHALPQMPWRVKIFSVEQGPRKLTSHNPSEKMTRHERRIEEDIGIQDAVVCKKPIQFEDK